MSFYDERRFKILRLPQCTIDGLFMHWRENAKNSRLLVPDISGIPSGSKPVNVQYDAWNERLLVLLWNPEWPVVPINEEIPFLNDPLAATVQAVEVQHIPGLAVERLHPKEGDLIVVRVPESTPRAELKYLADDLGKWSEQLGVKAMLLPHGYQVEIQREPLPAVENVLEEEFDQACRDQGINNGKALNFLSQKAKAPDGWVQVGNRRLRIVEKQEPPAVCPTSGAPLRGLCAVCEKPVYHAYPWWTKNPDKPGARPLHEGECFQTWNASPDEEAVREPAIGYDEKVVRACKESAKRINQHMVTLPAGTQFCADPATEQVISKAMCAVQHDDDTLHLVTEAEFLQACANAGYGSTSTDFALGQFRKGNPFSIDGVKYQQAPRDNNK